eukprot:jgi/Mesen1/1375/ME000013S00867
MRRKSVRTRKTISTEESQELFVLDSDDDGNLKVGQGSQRSPYVFSDDDEDYGPPSGRSEDESATQFVATAKNSGVAGGKRKRVKGAVQTAAKQSNFFTKLFGVPNNIAPNEASKKPKSKNSVAGSKEVGLWLPKQVPPQEELWVTKYAPSLETDLAVHKKKVEEVRSWLKSQKHLASMGHKESRLLLLTGPAGSGKKVTLEVLAHALQFHVTEWTTPVPTLWNEHLHQGTWSGTRYVSKLDEFEEFLDIVKKFPSLNLTSVAHPADSKIISFGSQEKSHLSCRKCHQTNQDKGGDSRPTKTTSSVKWDQCAHKSQSSEISLYGQDKCQDSERSQLVVLKDLPFTSNRERREKVCDSLCRLALSTRLPTVVIMTESATDGRKGDGSDAAQDFRIALEKGGASKISFNPITAKNVAKVLKRVTAAEACQVGAGVIQGIAEGCNGDLRHAVSTLQFLSLGRQFSSTPTWDPAVGVKGKVRQASTQACDERGTPEAEAAAAASFVCSNAARDNLMLLYHAVARICYSRRRLDQVPDAGCKLKMELAEHLRRHPPDMVEPEVFLAQVQTETPTLAAFLHENMLDFVTDEAVEEVADMEAFLSDADILQSARSSINMSWRRNSTNAAPQDYSEPDPSLVGLAAAASVAARGLIYANVDPAPRKYGSPKAPVSCPAF